MLAFFKVKRTFCKLSASVTVDLELKEASFLITYDGRIVHNSDLSKSDFENVKTPEAAEAWFSKPCGEHGSLIETLEQRYRRMANAA